MSWPCPVLCFSLGHDKASVYLNSYFLDCYLLLTEVIQVYPIHVLIYNIILAFRSDPTFSTLNILRTNLTCSASFFFLSKLPFSKLMPLCWADDWIVLFLDVGFPGILWLYLYWIFLTIKKALIGFSFPEFSFSGAIKCDINYTLCVLILKQAHTHNYMLQDAYFHTIMHLACVGNLVKEEGEKKRKKRFCLLCCDWHACVRYFLLSVLWNCWTGGAFLCICYAIPRINRNSYSLMLIVYNIL